MDLGAGNDKNYIKARIYDTASWCCDAEVFKVQYSDDDATYNDAATNFVPHTSGWNEISWTSKGYHRFWRFYVTTAGSSSYLNQIEMYDRPVWVVK